MLRSLFVCFTTHLSVNKTCNQSFLLALVQFVVFVGGLLSQLTSGLWLKNLGFIPPYWFIFACHVASTLCVIFLVPESTPKTAKKKIRFFSLDSFRAIWNVYKKPRNGGRVNLIMLLIGDGIVNLGIMGISGVVALFVLRSPLCWGPTTLGAFMAFRFFMQGFGGILGIGILKRFMSEINVTRIGMVSLCVSLVFFAFCDRTWMVFLGKQSLGSCCVPEAFFRARARVGLWLGDTAVARLTCAKEIKTSLVPTGYLVVTMPSLPSGHTFPCIILYGICDKSSWLSAVV